MLHRSLGAPTFAGFWRYWNPVFGYLLGRYVFKPFRRVMPAPMALVGTFIVCGGVHDAVTAIVRGAPAFLFTPWFAFLGIGVIGGNAIGLDFSNKPWIVRAAANLTYLAACLALTLALTRFVLTP